MAIDYASKYSGAVDERFKEVSKSQLCTNDDFDFGYGKSIVLYDISTAEMHDYSRSKTDGSSRYGTLENLNATKEELLLSKDRSFTFVIDKMDKDETVRALESAKALDRQIREVVSPEIDEYRYEKMCSSAGTIQEGVEITEDNIYDLVDLCTKVLSDNPLFFLINSYTTGISSKVLENILNLTVSKNYKGKVSSGEVGLPMENSNLVLPCGIFGRWEN